MSNPERPPPFKPSETIELSSVEGSKIIGVSVYYGRAEITRLFKFKAHTGQNQVFINGLPSVLYHDSLRVEGRGDATIHDVTISTLPRTPTPTTPPHLEALLHKKDRTVKAIERCKKSLESVELYLGTLNVQHIAMSELRAVMADYEKTAEELDIRELELKAQLQDVSSEIEVEQKKLMGSAYDTQLGLRVAIRLFAVHEGEVEMILTYAVSVASWSAGYDIRIDMQAKEKPVTLIYKAAITQKTGEDWTDVALTLETATPTFGVGVPNLDPWYISIFKPTPVTEGAYYSSPPQAGRILPQRAMLHDVREEFGVTSGSRRSIAVPMRHSMLEVTTKGNVSATFQVPGVISIPSDGVEHNVTITELSLAASMSWVCAPKVDTRVHLKAHVKNASEYALLRGEGSIYVDGSFISRSDIPAVSPGESFDCPLGLDPSIRVTYHPRVKKVSQSGFYTKTSNHVYSQQITVFNTKAVPVENVRIVDQVPVSEDEQVKVKVISPNLAVSVAPGEGLSKEKEKEREKMLQKVAVAKGVVVQWEGADEPLSDGDAKALGKNGKLNWVCAVPSQGKVNLVLQWEITAPVKAEVMGL